MVKPTLNVCATGEQRSLCCGSKYHFKKKLFELEQNEWHEVVGLANKWEAFASGTSGQAKQQQIPVGWICAVAWNFSSPEWSVPRSLSEWKGKSTIQEAHGCFCPVTPITFHCLLGPLLQCLCYYCFGAAHHMAVRVSGKWLLSSHTKSRVCRSPDIRVFERRNA